VAVGGNPGERMHRLLAALTVICAVGAVLPHQDRRW
jgi:hypothetical protein